MLRLKDRDEIAVVCDQFGNPTSALDIADAICAVIPHATSGRRDCFGTFHLAGSGDAAWSDLAEQALAVSGALGGPTARVKPIATIIHRPSPGATQGCRSPASQARSAIRRRTGASVAQTVERITLPDMRFAGLPDEVSHRPDAGGG